MVFLRKAGLPWITGQKVIVDSVVGLETGLLVLGLNCYKPVDSVPPPVFQIWNLRYLVFLPENICHRA